MGWWIAPLVGDIIEESVDEEKQESAKLKRETNKIFDPVIKLSNLSNNIQPNVTTNTVSQNTEPARTTLNNIDPDPEPDYAEVIPGLLESSTIVISQEPQMIPLPIPVMTGEESNDSYSVWGRKVVGN